MNYNLQGYPKEQCAEWLTMIRRFYPGVREVSIYWECVAALKEAEGDLKSAIDCYENAIIQGASVCLNNEFLALQLRKYNTKNTKKNHVLGGIQTHKPQ